MPCSSGLLVSAQTLFLVLFTLAGMQKLNLPEYDFKTKHTDGRTQIFDAVRKKYVALTPEEWVRQHFIHFLAEEKQFPKSLMAVEAGLKYNGLQKRGDLIVHNRNGDPVLIVECKAPSVKISQATFDQVARYNMALKVKYVVVTNGLNHYYCIIDFGQKSYRFIEELPKYDAL